MSATRFTAIPTRRLPEHPSMEQLRNKPKNCYMSAAPKMILSRFMTHSECSLARTDSRAGLN